MIKTIDKTLVVHDPWPFTICPGCGHHDFTTRDDDGTVIFTCMGCHGSWRYLLGYLVSVPSPPLR